ncbi:MAG TPA: DinB family protein [Dehalococcoidia bacterium]|nr:DinB family protein [Dehalococcoidia bacterium]
MSASADELLGRLRAARAETARRLGAMDPARLAAPASWRGAVLPLGFQVGWLAEADEARRVSIEAGAAWRASPPCLAQRVLLSGSGDFGRLIGTLAGVTEAQFNRQPAADEWGMREALAHVIAVDKRYLIATEHAVERRSHGDHGPLRPAADSMPPNTGETERHGTLDEMLERLVATHDAIVRTCGAIGDSYLDAPGEWASLNVDLRFRIHRFAAHDREHTAHLLKIRQQLGFPPTEPHTLLAQAQAARAAFETAIRFTADQPSPASELKVGSGAHSTTIGDLVKQALEDEALLRAALA